MVLCFGDPNQKTPDADITYISRLCDQNNVPFASNLATAEMLVLGLDFPDRTQLYRRIDLRVDKMLDAGLLDEAKLVYDHRQTYRTAAQAIGYKEFFPYFEGTAPLDACTEKLKQASRNYAKRQLTWFRHMDGVVWLDASAPDITARAVQLTQEFLAKG